MAVGDIKVDTTLDTDGDTITPGAGVVWKILSCGTSIEATNISLQISRVSDGNDMRLSQKGGSDNGSWAVLLGNLGAGTIQMSNQQIPLILDDTVALRLSGTPGGSHLTYASYVIVDE